MKKRNTNALHKADILVNEFQEYSYVSFISYVSRYAHVVLRTIKQNREIRLSIMYVPHMYIFMLIKLVYYYLGERQIKIKKNFYK